MKLRLVRLNPLTLAPGELILMGARQMDGLKIVQFPVRLEYLADDAYNQDNWQPVEFINEFQPDESDNAREVRPEVQVPVYPGPARNKRGGGNSGGGPA